MGPLGKREFCQSLHQSILTIHRTSTTIASLFAYSISRNGQLNDSNFTHAFGADDEQLPLRYTCIIVDFCRVLHTGSPGNLEQLAAQ
jgi:hypothetical protein